MERRRSARRVRRTCFHPLGEHAETSFVIDSQPVSDQQSRIFSISAVAERTIGRGADRRAACRVGDKTSLVASVTTRSGLAMHRGVGRLCTFSGTHFVTPRAVQAEITIRFEAFALTGPAPCFGS
jgi:hypothetical protein